MAVDVNSHYVNRRRVLALHESKENLRRRVLELRFSQINQHRVGWSLFSLFPSRRPRARSVPRAIARNSCKMHDIYRDERKKNQVYLSSHEGGGLYPVLSISVFQSRERRRFSLYNARVGFFLRAQTDLTDADRSRLRNRSASIAQVPPANSSLVGEKEKRKRKRP